MKSFLLVDFGHLLKFKSVVFRAKLPSFVRQVEGGVKISSLPFRETNHVIQVPQLALSGRSDGSLLLRDLSSFLEEDFRSPAP